PLVMATGSRTGSRSIFDGCIRRRCPVKGAQCEYEERRVRADRVSQAGTGLLIGFGASLLLAGCAAESAQSGRGASAAGTVPVHASGQLHPGSIRNGAQIGEMAAQYASARRGPVAATGASAW